MATKERSAISVVKDHPIVAVLGLAIAAASLYFVFKQNQNDTEVTSPAQASQQTEAPSATVIPSIAPTTNPSSGAYFGGQSGATMSGYIGGSVTGSFNTSNTQSYASSQYTYSPSQNTENISITQPSAPQTQTPTQTTTATQATGGSDLLSLLAAGGIGAVAASVLHLGAPAVATAATGGSIGASGAATGAAAATGTAATGGSLGLAIAAAPVAIAGLGVIATTAATSSSNKALGYGSGITGAINSIFNIPKTLGTISADWNTLNSPTTQKVLANIKAP